jgi:putative ABC transport system permease protein
MRSTLTIMGIAMGIGAVVCVVAIGDAGSKQIQDRMNNLGENLVWIEAGNRNVRGVRTGSHGTKTLIADDMRAIQSQVPMIKYCSPQVDSRVQIVYQNQNWNSTYRGVSPEYLSIKRWEISQGAAFTQEAVERAANVVVLGQTVRDILFQGEDPIGKTVRINSVPFTVIGILAPKGMTGWGNDQDDTLLMPYTTAQRKLAGKTWLNDILCSSDSLGSVRPAGDMAATLLRERHRIQPDQDDDFTVRNPEDMLQLRMDANRTMSLLLIAVGSVSLLVGGIGIMNVMLVSVTERTREIGVRLAVGATEGQVRFQFLSEAVILCLGGGTLGILIGFIGTIVLGRTMGWPMEISADAVSVAALFSVAVGVFFGYYPARKAASLDPIEALRFE